MILSYVKFMCHGMCIAYLFLLRQCICICILLKYYTIVLS